MCEWGTNTEIEIRRTVMVDSCIAPQIMALNDQGVHTTGCCCGHGVAPATATIYPHSVKRAKELGYDVTFAEGSDPVLRVRAGDQPPGGDAA